MSRSTLIGGHVDKALEIRLIKSCMKLMLTAVRYAAVARGVNSAHHKNA